MPKHLCFAMSAFVLGVLSPEPAQAELCPSIVVDQTLLPPPVPGSIPLQVCGVVPDPDCLTITLPGQGGPVVVYITVCTPGA